MKPVFAILIIAVLVGTFFAGRVSVPLARSITIGTTVVKDTVVRHDTVTTQIPRAKINISKKILPVDTSVDATSDSVATEITDTVTLTPDSTVCYSFSQQYASGAYARAELCSKFFPVIVPDMSGSIVYVPANDTTRSFYRIDTVQIVKNKTAFSWYMMALGVAVGLVGAVLMGR